MLGWHHDQDRVARRYSREIGGSLDARVKIDAGQKRPVDMARIDIVNDLGFARP